MRKENPFRTRWIKSNQHANYCEMKINKLTVTLLFGCVISRKIGDMTQPDEMIEVMPMNGETPEAEQAG